MKSALDSMKKFRHTQTSVSSEFFQLFWENFSSALKNTVYIPQNKTIVDREYILSLITSGTPADFARAVNLPFDAFAKQFYGEVLKIFYHYYDSCFQIQHFPVNFPYLVEYIFRRNASVPVRESQECILTL